MPKIKNVGGWRGNIYGANYTPFGGKFNRQTALHGKYFFRFKMRRRRGRFLLYFEN
jgi:hypothetical protein